MALTTIALISINSCKREFRIKTPYVDGDSSKAYLKVVDAAPFFRQSTGKPDTFNIFLNNTKVSGTPISYNGQFPQFVNNISPNITTTYIAVQPGLTQIKLSAPGKVTPDSIPITNLTENLIAGRKYTFLITDSLNSPRDSSRIFIQDPYIAPLEGYVNLRFINAVYNDTLGKTVDLFSYAKNTTILTKFKPGNVSAFQLIGYNIQTPDTFYVTRTLGIGVPATTPLSQRLILAKLAFTLSSGTSGNAGGAPQRTYTLFYKGDGNLTSGVKARSLGIYAH